MKVSIKSCSCENCRAHKREAKRNILRFTKRRLNKRLRQEVKRATDEASLNPEEYKEIEISKSSYRWA